MISTINAINMFKCFRILHDELASQHKFENYWEYNHLLNVNKLYKAICKRVGDKRV